MDRDWMCVLAAVQSKIRRWAFCQRYHMLYHALLWKRSSAAKTTRPSFWLPSLLLSLSAIMSCHADQIPLKWRQPKIVGFLAVQLRLCKITSNGLIWPVRSLIQKEKTKVAMGRYIFCYFHSPLRPGPNFCSLVGLGTVELFLGHALFRLK